MADRDISIVASSFEYELLRKIMYWVEPRLPRKGIIIEFGCQNGLLSRYYAISRPDLKLIGIDKNKLAIKSANKMTQNKNLKNINFIHADLSSPSSNLINQKANCIVSGRILSETMSLKPRFQLNWNQLEYPPIDLNLDNKMGIVINLCSKMLIKDGVFLITERLANYDRLNRLLFQSSIAGFSISKDEFYPIAWHDIAGDHSTWFLEAKKENNIKSNFVLSNALEIPLPSKEAEFSGDETRILFKGLLAFQTWSALRISTILKETSFSWGIGLEEHLEIGLLHNNLGYSFIGTNAGNYILSLFLEKEMNSVKGDLQEYIDYLKTNGGKEKNFQSMKDNTNP